MSGALVPSVLSARLSLLTQRRGDWVDNEYTGEENALGGHRDLAGRVQLLWTPMPKLEAWFKFHARDLDGTARLFRSNILLQGEGGLVQDFARDRIAHDGRNEQTLRTHGLAVEVRYDIGNFQLVSLTGLERLTNYSRGDIDGGYGAVFSPPSGPGEIPFPSETASGIPMLRQFSQEVRLMSAGARRLRLPVRIVLFPLVREDGGFQLRHLGWRHLGWAGTPRAGSYGTRGICGDDLPMARRLGIECRATII